MAMARGMPGWEFGFFLEVFSSFGSTAEAVHPATLTAAVVIKAFFRKVLRPFMICKSWIPTAKVVFFSILAPMLLSVPKGRGPTDAGNSGAGVLFKDR